MTYCFTGCQRCSELAVLCFSGSNRTSSVDHNALSTNWVVSKTFCLMWSATGLRTGPQSIHICSRHWSTLNPLTAVSRGSGYKFFVTLYHEPAVRIEHYMQNWAASRWPGWNDTCNFGPSAGGPDLHIGRMFKNRKKYFFSYNSYGFAINRI